MGKQTGIQWCDDTVNPTTGCDGCELWAYIKALEKFDGPCYAGNFHEARLAKSLPALYAPDFTEVRLAPGRMAKAVAAKDLTGTDRPDKPWLNGLPRIIFLGDMGDVMSGAVPFAYHKSEIIDHARSMNGRRHILMLLTKQPSRLAKLAEWLEAEHGEDWPENLWVGTSITTQRTTKRIDWLCKVPARVRFVSAEPLWEAVDLAPWLECQECHGRTWDKVDWHPIPCPVCSGDFRGIHQVIIGGQSDQGGHETRPFNVKWADSLIYQCRGAGVACFLKQVGSKPYSSPIDVSGADMMHRVEITGLRDSHGGDWTEWPERLRVREFPPIA